MADWYIETWVKAPLPVTSPIAHSPSCTRNRSSTASVRADGSRLTVASPRSSRLGVRPAATSSFSAVTVSSPTWTVNFPSAWATDLISAPVTTRTPSCASTSASIEEASGSSGPRMRGPASSSVTRTPNRANTWVISHPIGPPPTTTSEDGSDVTCTASRLVQ